MEAGVDLMIKYLRNVGVGLLAILITVIVLDLTDGDPVIAGLTALLSTAALVGLVNWLDERGMMK